MRSIKNNPSQKMWNPNMRKQEEISRSKSDYSFQESFIFYDLFNYNSSLQQWQLLITRKNLSCKVINYFVFNNCPGKPYKELIILQNKRLIKLNLTNIELLNFSQTFQKVNRTTNNPRSIYNKKNCGLVKGIKQRSQYSKKLKGQFQIILQHNQVERIKNCGPKSILNAHLLPRVQPRPGLYKGALDAKVQTSPSSFYYDVLEHHCQQSFLIIVERLRQEIILIDMDSDSQNKKIEDRFACVDCICENPQIKYQSIENVDKQWKEFNTESERVLKEYKNESKEKKTELLNQIAHMRKNYNKKLNEISDKLIAEQFLNRDKTQQSNQTKKISIQTLGEEQLLKDLKQLIEKEKDKEKVSQSQIIINLKNKDQIFKKDIQYHLESLQQYDQQDIQQSLDILKDISIEKNLIIQLIDMIQEMQKCAQKDENYQNQMNFIKEIQELIDQAKKYQCQLNLFDQTIMVYQQKCKQTLLLNELKIKRIRTIQ
ncbi:unnamed protein product [Paramecium primaurelia]|uniref:Uncharacterized protein n=1 Tax=Paramecium primaurelia TaxID=5886 RepID=A0A8S1QR41_PARPR|nr:unnamed protein product [Paramecium primaurelia]